MTTPRDILLLLFATLVGSVAAEAQSAAAAPSPDYYRADSVVLERTRTPFGGPAHRIAITRAGEVHFTALRGTRGRGAGPIAPANFAILMAHASTSAFAELPHSIMDDKTFCRHLHTDAATVTVVLYLLGGMKRVVDYQGCDWAPAALRQFEAAIERAAGVNLDGRPS